MCVHRTALRLRVLSPVLLSQNNRQLNRPQSLSLTDFEGSRFNRWLRQGSGQHPLTGSPQHQWGFLVSGKPGNRLTACCSGALAVLFGSGQSPGAGHHYSPRHISPCHILDHQDCDFGLGAGGNWRIISATWPLKKVISSLSCLTNSLSSGSGSGWPWSSISTNNIRRLFCIFFSAFNVPALMALRIVPVWQFRSLAASSIVTCMSLPVACASCLSRVYRQYLVQACTCLCRFEANCLCMYKILPIHGCALCKQVRNG